MTQNDDFQRWRTALRVYKTIQTKFMGGDLDEVIDVQITKSRDLWYFLNEISLSDIDEIIDFQKIK